MTCISTDIPPKTYSLLSGTLVFISIRRLLVWDSRTLCRVVSRYLSRFHSTRRFRFVTHLHLCCSLLFSQFLAPKWSVAEQTIQTEPATSTPASAQPAQAPRPSAATPAPMAAGASMRTPQTGVAPMESMKTPGNMVVV